MQFQKLDADVITCKNMYVQNKCIVANDSFKCKYIVVKPT